MPEEVNNYEIRKKKESKAFKMSIFSGVGVYYFLSRLLNYYGFETYIDYDEPHTVYNYYVDYEVYGGHTDIGMAVLLLSFMILWKIYVVVQYGRKHIYAPDIEALKMNFIYLGAILFFITRHIVMNNFDFEGVYLNIALLSTALIPVLTYILWNKVDKSKYD